MPEQEEEQLMWSQGEEREGREVGMRGQEGEMGTSSLLH